jgi:hypothetical protein
MGQLLQSTDHNIGYMVRLQGVCQPLLIFKPHLFGDSYVGIVALSVPHLSIYFGMSCFPPKILVFQEIHNIKILRV